MVWIILPYDEHVGVYVWYDIYAANDEVWMMDDPLTTYPYMNVLLAMVRSLESKYWSYIVSYDKISKNNFWNRRDCDVFASETKHLDFLL